MCGAASSCGTSPPTATAAATSGTAGSTRCRSSSSSPSWCSLSSSRSESFFASAPRGLEDLLLKEITSLGGANAVRVAGGVAFSGSWDACYRVNLWSRIASRVLWRVAEFQYASENDVYAAAKAVDWTKYFAVEQSIRVNVTA